MALKDLVRGGDPIRVLEKSGSQGLRQWDRIATRVIRLRDCNVISGTLMHFKRENSDVLIGRLNRLKKQAAKGTQRHNRKYERGSDQGVHPDRSAVDQLLVRAAPLFTNLWLEEAISDARPTKLPELHNAEGDPIAFSKLHFPLRQGVTAEQVIKALNQIPSLRSEGDGFWNWLAPPGRKPQALPASAVGQILISTMDDGSLVLGVVTLEGRRLTLETNSEARAARGRTLLAPIIQVCDAISGARPGARREVVEAYIQRLRDLENLALEYPGVSKSFAIQAGRELRVMVEADRVTDDQADALAISLASRIETEMTYPGQVRVTVIREKRAVGIAR
jgi:hypothetical protein